MPEERGSAALAEHRAYPLRTRLSSPESSDVPGAGFRALRGIALGEKSSQLPDGLRRLGLRPDLLDHLAGAGRHPEGVPVLGYQDGRRDPQGLGEIAQLDHALAVRGAVDDQMGRRIALIRQPVQQVARVAEGGEVERCRQNDHVGEPQALPHPVVPAMGQVQHDIPAVPLHRIHGGFQLFRIDVRSRIEHGRGRQQVEAVVVLAGEAVEKGLVYPLGLRQQVAHAGCGLDVEAQIGATERHVQIKHRRVAVADAGQRERRVVGDDRTAAAALGPDEGDRSGPPSPCRVRRTGRARCR